MVDVSMCMEASEQPWWLDEVAFLLRFRGTRIALIRPMLFCRFAMK